MGYLTLFVAFLSLNLEVWSLLLWKFGLGSYVRSKFHWPLAPRSPVPWIKTSCCVESSKQRNVFCVVLMTLRSTMFWSTEPRIVEPKANETLISHNFQDQTSTAKVIIPPKNLRKVPQMSLKNLFWKINLIKMMKIFICDLIRDRHKKAWNMAASFDFFYWCATLYSIVVLLFCIE